MPCWPKREAGATSARGGKRKWRRDSGLAARTRPPQSACRKMSEDAACEWAAPAARASANARARVLGGGPPRALKDANRWFELTGSMETLISTDRIQARIRELAAEIEAAYPPGEESIWSACSRAASCSWRPGTGDESEGHDGLHRRLELCREHEILRRGRMLKDFDSGLPGIDAVRCWPPCHRSRGRHRYKRGDVGGRWSCQLVGLPL